MKGVYAYCRAFHIRSLALGKYGKYPVPTTNGITWYILKIVNSSNKKQHHIIHLPYEKSIIEEPFTILNKDTTESFDDYFRVEMKEDVNKNTF